MDTTPVALVLAAPDLAPVGAGPAREVDAALGGGAVGMVLGGGMLEGVTGIRPRGGPGSAEDVAEFGEEKLAVGTLGSGGVAPAGDEGGDGGGTHAAQSWGLGARDGQTKTVRVRVMAITERAAGLRPDSWQSLNMLRLIV